MQENKIQNIFLGFENEKHHLLLLRKPDIVLGNTHKKK